MATSLIPNGAHSVYAAHSFAAMALADVWLIRADARANQRASRAPQNNYRAFHFWRCRSAIWSRAGPVDSQVVLQLSLRHDPSSKPF